MHTKILIILGYNSRRIVNTLFGFYLLLLVILYGSVYKSDLPWVYVYLFFFILGLFVGMNLMTWIIKFLNKKEINEKPTFQKLIKKDK